MVWIVYQQDLLIPPFPTHRWGEPNRVRTHKDFSCQNLGNVGSVETFLSESRNIAAMSRCQISTAQSVRSVGRYSLPLIRLVKASL